MPGHVCKAGSRAPCIIIIIIRGNKKLLMENWTASEL